MDSTAGVFSSVKFATRVKSSSLTGRVIAERLGVTPTTVSALGRGRKAPSADVLCRIPSVLGGATTDYLNLPPRSQWELRHFRLVAGLTQQAVANDLGVAAAAVSGWERRRYKPPVVVLPKLAELYSASQDELVAVIERVPGLSPAQALVAAADAVVMLAEVMLRIVPQVAPSERVVVIDITRRSVEHAMGSAVSALPELRDVQVRSDAAEVISRLAELNRQINHTSN